MQQNGLDKTDSSMFWDAVDVAIFLTPDGVKRGELQELGRTKDGIVSSVQHVSDFFGN